MTHEAQPRLHPGPLAIELRVRIGRARMGRVGALLAPEVRVGIAAALRRGGIVWPLLRSEALYRGPGLHERAVHTEMVAREEPLDPGPGPGSRTGSAPQARPPEAGPGSSRRSSGPTPDRPSRAQRTTETEDRARSAP